MILTLHRNRLYQVLRNVGDRYTNHPVVSEGARQSFRDRPIEWRLSVQYTPLGFAMDHSRPATIYHPEKNWNKLFITVCIILLALNVNMLICSATTLDLNKIMISHTNSRASLQFVSSQFFSQNTNIAHQPTLNKDSSKTFLLI